MLKDKTYQAYSGLAKYCRTGNLNFVEGLDLRQDRIHHYRRLVFNITNNALKQAYPVAYRLLSTEQWESLVADFFENHDAQEYRIWLMPKEFYLFVKEKKYYKTFDIPFLNDLLLFEWIEIEVHTMSDEKFPEFKTEGDLWNDVFVLNPEYKLLELQYPVHTKKTNAITKDDKAYYYLLVYREFNNMSVQFMNLPILFAYVIEQIEEGFCLKEIINAFCELSQSKVNNEDVEVFVNSLKSKNIILGFK